MNAERLRAQVLGLMAPQAVDMQATVQTRTHDVSSPEDEDLTPEQIDAELEAIAEVLRLSRGQLVQTGRSEPDTTAERGHSSF